jgi:transcriptional regulator with XRE-family HTH domain
MEGVLLYPKIALCRKYFLMQKSLAARLRVLRARRGLSLLAASEELGVDRHTLRDLELGRGRTPRYPTLAKIAEGYDVPVEDLLEDGPSLKELHEEAECKTDWLTRPEEEWQASLPRSLTPLDAMQIVQEMAEEFSALKPLIAAQEVGLPIYKSAISGRYRQAWLRFLEGMRAAHKCGVANGLITQEETLNDLEKKLELGETPGVRYEGMLLAS